MPILQSSEQLFRKLSKGKQHGWILLLGILLIAGLSGQRWAQPLTIAAQTEAIVSPAAQANLLLLHTDVVVLTANGGQTGITAIVRDVSGQPVGGAIVQFTSTAGNIVPASTTTDSNGIVTATFTAGERPGQVTLTATSNGVAQTAFLQIQDPQSANAVSTLQLVVTASELSPGVQTEVIATLLNPAGQPISGELVAFFGSHGAVSPASALTTMTGQVKTTFTAGQMPGQARITVIAGNVTNSSTLVVKGIGPVATPTANTTSLFLPLITRK